MAVERQNLDVVVQLLDLGASLTSALQSATAQSIEIDEALKTRAKNIQSIDFAKLMQEVQEASVGKIQDKAIKELKRLIEGQLEVYNLDFWKRDNPRLLQVAVRSKNPRVGRLLLSLGASPEEVSPLYTEPPIFTAVLNKDFECVKMLMETGEISQSLRYFCPIQRRQMTLLNFMLTNNNAM